MNVVEISSARYRRRSMLMQFPEIFGKLALSINVKICLVAEEYHSSGCNEPSQVVLLCIGKLGKVDAMDLSANLGVVIEDVGSIGKEVTEVRVTLNTSVMVRYLCQGLPMNVWEHWTKIVMFIIVVCLDSCAARFVGEDFVLLDR